MRVSAIDKERPEFVEDLSIVDRTIDSLAISDKTKNISSISEFNPKNLWLICLNQKQFDLIIKQVDPRYLSLYGCRVSDLSYLSQLSKLSTLILNWNSKAETLWDIGANVNLKHLHLEDLSKVKSIDQLINANSLEYLGIEGGWTKSWKLASLAPLSELSNLRQLTLMGLQVQDKSLHPLSQLTRLEELEVSNQFKAEEFARLSTKLRNTKCDKFKAYSDCEISKNGALEYDVMVTGSGKPFLNSHSDKVKLDKYVKQFEKLVSKYETEN